MSEQTTIHKMKLHMSGEANNMHIIRVSGGWLYRIKETPIIMPVDGNPGMLQIRDVYAAPVFVPYSTELIENTLATVTILKHDESPK